MPEFKVQRGEAGRPGFTWELHVGQMYIMGPSQFCTVTVHKLGERLQTEVHSLQPPGDRICTIMFPVAGENFRVNRECIPGFDDGGPWYRGYMPVEILRKYLAILGMQVEVMDQEGESVITNVWSCEPVNPHPQPLKVTLIRTSSYEVEIEIKGDDTPERALGRWLALGGADDIAELEDSEVECWVHQEDGTKKEVEPDYDLEDDTEDAEDF